jgi:hypothetical protein
MRTLFVFLVLGWASAGAAVAAAAPAPDCAVVVSRHTLAGADWKKVVTALADKHQANVLSFEAAVEEVLPESRRQFPRMIYRVAFEAEPLR